MNFTEEYIEYIIELLSEGIEPDVSFHYSELQYPYSEIELLNGVIEEQRLMMKTVMNLLQKELADSRIENTLPTETQALIEHMGGDE